MTIKAKILGLVATFAIVAAAICGLGLITMQDYHRAISDYTRASDDAFDGERLNLLVADSIIEMRNIYISKSPDEIDRHAAALTSRIDATSELMTTWRARLQPGEMPYFEDMDKGAKSVGAFGHKVIAIAPKPGPRRRRKVRPRPQGHLWA
ncbi:MAG: hypothetical protein WDN06_20335 [Asticcacaulis sp.]